MEIGSRIAIIAALIAGCSKGADEPSGVEPPTSRAMEPAVQHGGVVAPAAEPDEFDYRLLVVPELPMEEIRRRVADAAQAAGFALKAGGTRSKCRVIHFLDSETHALQRAGYALRQRRKYRDSACQDSTGDLAVSFNLRTGDIAAASAARRDLAPAAEIPKNRIKNRFKRSTVVRPGALAPGYLAGGTVRRLEKFPETLGELRQLFPGTPQVPGTDDATRLAIVNGLAIEERNNDFGAAGHMPIEIAQWKSARTILVTEIMFTHDAAGADDARRFMAILRAAFEGQLMDVESRVEVAYTSRREAQ